MANAKTDKTDAAAAPKKKGGKMKILLIALGGLVLAGGGAGAGLYLAHGSSAQAAADDRPKLVPKSEQPRPKADGAAGSDQPAAAGAMATPAGKGGDRYASTYYSFDKDFTANLQDSTHFVQVGLAVSTPYDAKVIDNLKANDIAIRSAVLMALGDTSEDQVFSSAGKRQLQGRLVAAINATLQQKEGFGGVGNVYFTNFVVQ